MARAKRDGRLETRTARAKLPLRHEAYWMPLEPSRALGYRKGPQGGVWMARFYDPEAKPPRRKVVLGPADDHADADGVNVFSFAQAQAKARAWFEVRREATTGEAIHKGPFTVKDAWEAYRKDCERRGVKAMDRTQASVGLHILPSLGEVDLTKLTRSRIEQWQEAVAAMPARIRSKKGADPVYKPDPQTDEERRARRDSTNRVLTILKAMLNHAKARRLTQASGDAWRDAKPFKGAASVRVRFLDPEEAQRLVNACEPDFRLLVTGALYTGARFSELTRLQVRDFNAAAGTIFIAESKSGKPRHVVLTEEGQTFFKAQATGREPEERLFTREAFEDRRRKEPETRKLIPKVHREWRRGDYARLWPAACTAAKIEPITFHELRHTYASMLVNRGVPLAYVAAQLGHADTRMVEKHYGHLAPSAMAEAIRKLAPKLALYESGNFEALRIQKR